MKNILLLHGWNYRNYHHLIENKSAWHNRETFIQELKKEYNVITIDLPGFGTKECPKDKFWTLEDYSKYVENYIIENKLNIEYIVGYSFGGAVAINYKVNHPNQKIILISPAIIRNQKKSKTFMKTPKILDPIRNTLRDLYIIHIKKTNEMVYGNKFLRRTYQSIVRVDLLNTVKEFKKEDYIVIYGDKDNMVKPHEVNKVIQENVKMISNGGHDIANTNPKEIVSFIKEFTK